MKEFDTYIFDLDGTLLSTLNNSVVSTNYALCWAGTPERTIEETRMFVGSRVKLLMERAIPNGTNNLKSEETHAKFHEHYLEHNLDTTSPYDGIPELLRELKRRSKKLTTVGNKFYAATQDLAKHFFPDTVRVATGERETIRKKSTPDTVLEALRQLGASKEGTVYIGGSDVDIITAKNCGLPCISVLWGFRDKDFLIQHGSTIFVNKPSETLDE